jgi:hypothetical protein
MQAHKDYIILSRASGSPRFRVGALLTLCALIFVALLAVEGPAQAVPSFSRQTGQACATCHTAFPELTPFGRHFKLTGYIEEGAKNPPPLPLAAMLMPGFTHTQSKQDAPPSPGLKTNDNLVTQQVTGFLAGGIYGNLGALVQVSGNPINGQVWFDGSDARYVDSFDLFGKKAYYGIDANNTPTFQDAWNTVNAWGFPQLSSGVAAFSPPGTHIDALAQSVAGGGAYVYWNDLVYAELTAYLGYNKSTLEAFGVLTPGQPPDVQRGAMPYWRLAVEPHWGDHYLMIGTYGMYGQTIPGGQAGIGADSYLDVGFDSQYQYDGQQYSVTLKLSDVMEFQKFNASVANGGASNVNDKLNSFKANATFVWDHTYSLTAGYFNVSGTGDQAWDSVAYGGPGTVNSPNGSGMIFDAAYLPFSHGAPGPYKYANVRLGVQYITYLNLYGGTNNFDGTSLGGTHNASGNNTAFLYAWAAF